MQQRKNNNDPDYQLEKPLLSPPTKISSRITETSIRRTSNKHKNQKRVADDSFNQKLLLLLVILCGFTCVSIISTNKSLTTVSKTTITTVTSTANNNIRIHPESARLGDRVVTSRGQEDHHDRDLNPHPVTINRYDNNVKTKSIILSDPNLVSIKEEEPKAKLIRFEVTNLSDTPSSAHLSSFKKSKGSSSSGTFYVLTRPSWSPLGVERFETLVKMGFYENCRFFRVLPNFVVQFGINGDPSLQKEWRAMSIQDDPIIDGVSNKKGVLTFAMAGKNTRSTQIFINKRDNRYLDREGFTPIAHIVEIGNGEDSYHKHTHKKEDSFTTVIDRIFSGYKEKPNQGKISNQGNSYLEEEFPQLSYITKATIIGPVQDIELSMQILNEEK